MFGLIKFAVLPAINFAIFENQHLPGYYTGEAKIFATFKVSQNLKLFEFF